MTTDFQWLNEPPSWDETAASVSVTTGEKTDFWRETFYGFVRDDGHFRYRWVEGDFTMETTFAGRYEELYDQAGLMIRLDEKTWIKSGIEYTDGAAHFSVVVTLGHSDWSVVRLDDVPERFTMRLTRHGEAIRIQYKNSKDEWQMARLAYFPPSERVMAGVMTCSPQRRGFQVRFESVTISPPISRELHA